MAENADLAHPQDRPAKPGALGLRLASALVMIPAALLVVWLGGVWFAGFVAIAAALMCWEWGRLVGRLRGTGDAILFLAMGFASVLAAELAAPLVGLMLMALGILAQWLLARGRDERPLWTAAGLAWILLPSIGFVWLRAAPSGLVLCFWALAVVWATDSAAYAAGKSLGGPRLAPRISPNKTWSGLAGGIVGAMLAGLATGLLVPGSPLPMLIALSGGLAVVEQIGDIAESFAKRRFGVKDSSGLIPGHGGLLDRLDGMLAVVAVLALLQILTDGHLVRWNQA